MNNIRKNSKLYQVIMAMRQDLKVRKLQPGEPFLTEQQATERYQVSRGTIRRAMDKLEQEGYLERIACQGVVVRKPPQSKVRLIAYLGQCLIDNGIEPYLIRGIESRLLNHESILMVANLENNIDRAQTYLDRFNESRVEGILFMPMIGMHEENRRIVELMERYHIPFVLLDRQIESLAGRHHAVVPDNRGGMRLLVDHLVALGHRRIAFYRPNALDSNPSLRERFEGYREGLEAHDLEFDPELDGFCPSDCLASQIQNWRRMPDPPTAIVASNDDNLQVLMDTMRQLGLRVPGDLSLTGFDDLPNARMAQPATTVHVAHEQLGRIAATCLLQLIEGRAGDPQTTVVDVSLKIRSTTGVNPFLVQEPAKQDN